MFLGHFALAFGARRALPAVSLGVLFTAVQFADLLWPVLVLAGVERLAIEPGHTAVNPLHFVHYPWSHSLVALVAWGVAFGALYAAWRRGGAKTMLILAALVVSHWILDVVSHTPDMPIAPGGGPLLGLGLWNSVAATVAVELGLFAACVAYYVRTTRAHDRVGSWGFWSLIAFFVAIYLASLAGPPPPSPDAVAYSALAMWLFVAWGHWVDAHRKAR